MSDVMELDLGPLTWVKSEIDLALSKATEALASPTGGNIQFAQTHLHQACGALSIVGLDGVTQFANALEQLLGTMARGERQADAPTVGMCRRALAATGNYLEELVHGTPDQPLRLMSLYTQIAEARGLPPPSPAELFYPDTSLRPARRNRPATNVDPARLEQHTRQLRTVYQRGLLKVLRGADLKGGAREMLSAVRAAEAIQDRPAAATFWWAAQALFEALASGDLPASPDLKRLCSSLDRELRRDTGTAGLPERVLREVLYFVSQAPVRTPLQRNVRETWKLDTLLPEEGAAVSEVPLAPLLQSLRTELAGSKRAWDEFSSGKTTALAVFQAQQGKLAQQAVKLRRPALNRLLKGLDAFSQWLRKAPNAFNEIVAIEVASAQLLVEAALSEGGPEAGFSTQVADTLDRLAKLTRGETLPRADQSATVRTARRGEEREAIGQVGREILSSLAQIEQRLDDFFRNQNKRAPLATLAGPLKQIEGALFLIGDEQATALIHEVAGTVSGLASGNDTPDDAVFETLAKQLSALGFYVQALQHGPASLETFLDPDAARARQAAAREANAFVSDEEHEHVEPTAKTAKAQATAASAPAAAEPPPSAAQQPVAPAEPETVKAPEPVVSRDSPPAPAATPAEPVAQAAPVAAEPAGSAQQEVDAELLEIFIEEAHDVLGNISEQLGVLRKAHDDQEALTSVRRAFHTLKGSGRMVGLLALGEVAWAVEQTLNRWLQMEWQPDNTLLSFLEQADTLFTEWVAQIEGGGSLDHPSAALVERAEALRERGTAEAETAPEPTVSPEDDVAEDASIEHASVEEETLDEDISAALEPSAELAQASAPAPDEPVMPADMQIEDPHFTESSDLYELALETNLGDMRMFDPSLEAPPSMLNQTVLVDLDRLGSEGFNNPDQNKLVSTEPDSLDIDPIIDLDESFDDIFADTDSSAPAAADDIGEALPDEMPAPERSAPAAQPVEDLAAEAAAAEARVEPITPEPIDEVTAIDEAVEAPLPIEVETETGTGAETAEATAEPDVVAPTASDDVLTDAVAHDEGPASEPLVVEMPEAEAPTEVEVEALSVDAAAETLPTVDDTPSFTEPEVIDLAAAEPEAPETESAVEAQAEDWTAATAEVETGIEIEEDTQAETETATDAGTADSPFPVTPALLDDISEGMSTPADEPVAAAEEAVEEAAEEAVETPEPPVEAVEEPEAQAELAAQAAEPAPAPAPLAAPNFSETVRIGDVELSRALFELFTGEAAQHIRTLKEEIDQLAVNPTRVPAETAVRAAHTFAGISGTARVQPMHQLGRALEHAFERLRVQSVPPRDDQLDLLDAVVDRLDGMLAEVVSFSMPLDVPEFEQALEQLGQMLEEVTPPVSLDLGAMDDLENEALEAAPNLAEEASQEDLSKTRQAVTDAPDTHEDLVQSEAEASGTGAFAPVESETAPDEPAPIAEKATVPVDEPAPEPAAQVHDDIDEQLLPIFIEEASDLISQLNTVLRDWEAEPDSADHAKSTARLLHTLKGSARMTGAMTLGEFVHQLETRLDTGLNSDMARSALIDEVITGADHVQQMVEHIISGEPEPDAAQGEAQGGEGAGSGTVAIEGGASEISSGIIKVRADLVDRFVNEAGEIGIARTRIEGELRTLRRSMLDLTENVIRLRNQLREVEIQAEVQMQSRMAQAGSQHADFDPLEMDRYTRLQELTRLMAESVGDVTTVQQNLLRNLDGAELALHGQARMSRDLQQALMQVRMVPFDSLADRLYRVVRQSAKDLGKRVNLDLRGGRIEVDRSVLDRITAPLEHLLRNAVAHGIESPEQRRAAGKDEIGQITLTVSHEANEILINLVDDGKGLNFDAIAARARERGLLGHDEIADTKRLTNLIFMPGFSTAESLSTVSGRGVGMDVVKSETAAVGGRLDVSSRPQQGTQFQIYLPLTLAVTQAVLVRGTHHTYAIPSSMVAQVMELKTDALQAMRDAGGTEWNGEHFSYRYLPQLLGDHAAQPELQRFNWVLLLRVGAQTLALHVDSLRGNQEIVVKNAGPQLVRIIGITGATVLGDGEIVLILNPVALASRSLGMRSAPRLDAQGRPQEAPAPQVEPRIPTVMIVDDSLTVRKITGRLLEREGYRVTTAKDGADALEKLIETLPDVILSDIEMPRMDGFDLLRNIRADDRTRDIPVVMITSRLADKHRQYALKLGANEYLGKPFEEDELLGLLKSFTQTEASPA
ncbi:MAG: Hpt domain-containing protein [Rhodocyclaceae bacterium]